MYHYIIIESNRDNPKRKPTQFIYTVRDEALVKALQLQVSYPLSKFEVEISPIHF